jgi:long-chain acyl-CoA synthetase
VTAPVPTVATRIRDRAQQDPRGVALREKSLGIWQETTWAAYADLVERAAHGLLELGVRAGDSIAIQSENRPEWLIGDAGAVAARAATVGLDPASPAVEVERVLRDSAARVLLAEDQEQVDKALAVKAALPELQWIVYIEPRGVRDYPDPALVWWPELLARGAEHRACHPHLLNELAGAIREDEPAGLALAAAGGLHPDPRPSDFVLAHLPLWQISGRIGSGWLNAHAGVQLHFGEPSADPIQTLREVRPSLFLGTPRTWEQVRAASGAETPPASRLACRAVRDRLGMGKCRSAVSTSALPPELADWYRGLRMPVCEAQVDLAEAVG